MFQSCVDQYKVLHTFHNAEQLPKFGQASDVFSSRTHDLPGHTYEFVCN